MKDEILNDPTMPDYAKRSDYRVERSQDVRMADSVAQAEIKRLRNCIAKLIKENNLLKEQLK